MRNIKIICLLIFSILSVISCKTTKVEATKIDSNSEVESKPTEPKELITETDEEKAIRLAEEFIKRNGYTDSPADKDNLSHETIGFTSNIDELLKFRHNSLEAKAYGISHHGRGGQKGWTVIFRYTRSYLKNFHGEQYNLSGRSVVMNEKFEKLLVEHKTFVLKYVEKKLK